MADGRADPSPGVAIRPGIGDLVPELEKYIARYWPGNTTVRSLTRSLRFSSVPATTQASLPLNFQFGGLVIELAGSSSGLGVNVARNAPNNTMWELQLTYQNDVPLWDNLARADALFGEDGDKHRWFLPPLYVPAESQITVTVNNLLASTADLINVLFFTLEPRKLG